MHVYTHAHILGAHAYIHRFCLSTLPGNVSSLNSTVPHIIKIWNLFRSQSNGIIVNGDCSLPGIYVKIYTCRFLKSKLRNW